MADLIVERGAHTFREALVIKRRRDSAVLCCKIVNDLIDLCGAHPDTDLFGYCV